VRAGRNGVNTALVPGVAFSQSGQGEVTAAENTVRGYSLPGVAGTTGVKTAVITEKRTQADLVAVNKEYEQAAH
jgi:hypothetical protein